MMLPVGEGERQDGLLGEMVPHCKRIPLWQVILSPTRCGASLCFQKRRADLIVYCSCPLSSFLSRGEVQGLGFQSWI